MSTTVETKIIPLSLAKSYVSDWGVEQAVRELIQNCLDLNGSVTVEKCHSQRGSEIKEGNSLFIESYDGAIPHKHLLLGSGTKTNDKNSIGGFSEGLKLALLIMAREDIHIEFYNGRELWRPFFMFNDHFQEDCLHIEVSNRFELDKDVVRIVIHGLDEDLEVIDEHYGTGEPSTLSKIIDNTLVLQDQGYSKHETTYGNILLEPHHKKKIFCGGLYVGECKEFEEGFDFKPTYLKLDRDRRMIDSFNLKWMSKEMWGELSENPSDDTANYIAEGLSNGNSSMQFLHHADEKVSDKVKEKVLDLYNENYSGKILTSTYGEKQELSKAGNQNIEFVARESFVKILKQTQGYKEIVLNTKMENPLEWLEDFKDKWYDSMDTDMLHDYEDMCERLQKVLK